ncbi:hypothetical protein [Acidiplasma cupricumulans]|nr:hypothetical protein [Acidiplasma cupricumulans]
MKIIQHIIIPVIGSVFLILAIYYSFVPLPSYPYSIYAIAAGVWIILGIIYALIKSRNVEEIATVNVD